MTTGIREEKPKADFDPDYSPQNPQNKQAAKDHNLRYSKKFRAYVDKEGAPVRDQFGQPL